MDSSTKTMAMTFATGLLKKGLITLGSVLTTHGIIASNETETVVAVGMAAAGLGWSFWNDYGKAIVLSQFEILKAKSLAQAAALRQNRIPQVTVEQIANKSPTMNADEVAKLVPTLPASVQANINPT